MTTLLAVLLFTSLACVGLLATWAATSGRHWFFRTAVFVGAIGLLLLIPAYEPFVAFALQGAVVAAGVQIARARKQGLSTSFSLATLLQGTVFVAIAAAVASQVPALNARAWVSVAMIGLIAGLATLLGLWMVHGRLVRLWLRLALGLILALSLSLPLVWGDWFVFSMSTVWAPIIAGLVAITCLVFWLLVAFGFRSRAKRVVAGIALLLLAVVLVSPPAGVYYQLMTPLPIPEQLLPNPNGYDDIVAAGKIAENWKFNNTTYGYDTAPQKELAAAVEQMQPAYQLLQVGLKKSVLSPIDYLSTDSLNIDVYTNIGTLARSLTGRGRMAELENKIDDAFGDYLETIRLGYVVRRGGLVVHALVGIGSSGKGRRGLFKLRNQIAPRECDKIISILTAHSEQAEPDENFIYRDRVWTQHAMGWHGHFMQILDDMSEESSWSAMEWFIRACRRERAEMRLLQVELALRAWQATHGGLPESLDDLVPEFLSAVPADPFDTADSPLRYQRTEETYVLYSVGADGKDDGGVPPEDCEDTSTWGVLGDGDLRLDLLYADDPAAVPAETDDDDAGDDEADDELLESE